MSHLWMRHITHIYGWVIWHMWVSHVTHIYHACHTYERVMYTYEWVTSHVWMSHITRMNESCHTYEWVTSHIWMGHVTHIGHACHTCEWVMSHIWMSHFTHICHDYTHIHESCTHVNVSGYMYEWVTSHVWTSHVTHIRWRSRGLATPMKSGRYSLPSPPHPLLSSPLLAHMNESWHILALGTHEWVMAPPIVLTPPNSSQTVKFENEISLSLSLSLSLPVWPLLSLFLPLSIFLFFSLSPSLPFYLSLSLSPSLSQSLSLSPSRAYIFTCTRTHMVPGIIICKSYWQRSWLIDRVHEISHGTHEWVLAHMNESWRIWMSHGTHEWVMAHMDESWHTWMSHATDESVMAHMNESWHVCMSHGTYRRVVSNVMPGRCLCVLRRIQIKKVFLCTAYPIWRKIFKRSFQSLKLKARSFVFTETRQKRRSSFRLELSKELAKMSLQMG